MTMSTVQSNSKYSEDVLGFKPKANCYINPKVKE